MGELRLTPAYDNHDFAEEIPRAGASAPRFCASVPVTYGDNPHGSSSVPGGKSAGPGRYRKDGNSASARTSPGFTSCSIENSVTGVSSRASAAEMSAKARLQFVVPRSIPITNFAEDKAGYSTSISAGAITVTFWLAAMGGRFVVVARHPRCRSVPPAALPPTGTLPRSFTVAGSPFSIFA